MKKNNPYQLWACHRPFYEEKDHSLGCAKSYRTEEKALMDYSFNENAHGEVTVMELREYETPDNYQVLATNIK